MQDNDNGSTVGSLTDGALDVTPTGITGDPAVIMWAEGIAASGRMWA